jgi:hypothetical protein
MKKYKIRKGSNSAVGLHFKKYNSGDLVHSVFSRLNIHTEITQD